MKVGEVRVAADQERIDDNLRNRFYCLRITVRKAFCNLSFSFQAVIWRWVPVSQVQFSKDFEILKIYLLRNDGWKLEYEKGATKVWSRIPPETVEDDTAGGNSFKMIRVISHLMTVNYLVRNLVFRFSYERSSQMFTPWSCMTFSRIRIIEKLGTNSWLKPKKLDTWIQTTTSPTILVN